MRLRRTSTITCSTSSFSTAGGFLWAREKTSLGPIIKSTTPGLNLMAGKFSLWRFLTHVASSSVVSS